MRRQKMHLEQPKRKMLRRHDATYLCLGMVLLFILNMAQGSQQCSELVKTCKNVITTANIQVDTLQKNSESQTKLINDQESMLQSKDQQIDALLSEGTQDKLEVGLASSVLTALIFVIFIL